MIKIVTIVGARPQFIKAAAVSRAINSHNQSLDNHTTKRIQEMVIHTGQHYDYNMSEIFFKELEIREPQVNLNIGSGYHGRQTGEMLIRIEEILFSEKPDIVLIYGDTNSTLAGALAAVKLLIPIAHVEAGLRSFNNTMPEEHNRVLADHCSKILFCPTHTSVINLQNEGITKGVHHVGDVMYDSVLYNTELAEKQSRILHDLSLRPKTYILATIHRAENTDNESRLKSIVEALETISSNGDPVIVPLHPRTQKIIHNLDIKIRNTNIIEPVSYLDMLMLEKGAKAILTDSGGVQKEAYWMKVPCITLRDETEWIETVDAGWNKLAGADTNKIINSIQSRDWPNRSENIFGDGESAKKIVQSLILHNSKSG